MGPTVHKLSPKQILSLTNWPETSPAANEIVFVSRSSSGLMGSVGESSHPIWEEVEEAEALNLLGF